VVGRSPKKKGRSFKGYGERLEVGATHGVELGPAVAAKPLGVQTVADLAADEGRDDLAQRWRKRTEQGGAEALPALWIHPTAPHADEIEVILDQTLEGQSLGALLAAQLTVELDAASAHEMRDDQAAVAEHRAIVVLDERQLPLGALTGVAGGNDLVGQPGKPEPRLELEGERADIAAEHRRKLMEPDHRRAGASGSGQLAPDLRDRIVQ
jgi:hypothetical protein